MMEDEPEQDELSTLRDEVSALREKVAKLRRLLDEAPARATLDSVRAERDYWRAKAKGELDNIGAGLRKALGKARPRGSGKGRRRGDGSFESAVRDYFLDAWERSIQHYLYDGAFQTRLGDAYDGEYPIDAEARAEIVGERMIRSLKRHR